MSAPEPRIERPQVPDGYGIPQTDDGMLPWVWAEERLHSAPNFWFSTVRPDGRPHSSPVWAVWHEGRVYFDGSPETRRMKNIAANPNVSVHLESGNEVVILEGLAEAVSPPPPRDLAERLATRYAEKYHAYGYAPSADQWDEGGLYVMTPRIGLAWALQSADEFGKTYTRYRWDR